MTIETVKIPGLGRLDVAFTYSPEEPASEAGVAQPESYEIESVHTYAGEDVTAYLTEYVQEMIIDQLKAIKRDMA